MKDTKEALLTEALETFDMAKASTGKPISFSVWFSEALTRYAREIVKEAVPEEHYKNPFPIKTELARIKVGENIAWNACCEETLRRAEELLGKEI